MFETKEEVDYYRGKDSVNRITKAYVETLGICYDGGRVCACCWQETGCKIVEKRDYQET